MTSYYPFTPNQNGAFSFQPTLDGAQYLATIKWNLFGQRWYLALTDLTGALIVNIPVIESLVALPLASISWSNGIVSAVTRTPHGYQIGSTVVVLVQDCVPSAYNGVVNALVADNVTLQYPLTANPGTASTIGAVEWSVNIVAGYFTASTMIFRNRQFEVSP